MFPRGINTETPSLAETNDGAKLERKKDSRNSLQKSNYRTLQNAIIKITERYKTLQQKLQNATKRYKTLQQKLQNATRGLIRIFSFFHLSYSKLDSNSVV